LGNGFRVRAHVGGKRHRRIAAPLTDALDAGSGITFEHGAVLGKGELARGVLRGLPV
jgi:hypothetical protein